jgi:hypothetical protein
MGIRSWFERRSQEKDEAAVKRAEEEAVESADELAHSDRWGMAADQRIAWRVGEGSMSDVDRLSDR